MIIFWQSLRLFIFLTFLTGVAYPLLITGFAYLVFNDKSTGSLIRSNDHIIGSALIGQKFEGMNYFWPRPSAIDYKPLPSGGSNLGPTSKVLKQKVEERRQHILKSHELNDTAKIPVGLLFASGSGLDPHIRVQAAYFQVDRVAKARGLTNDTDKEKIKKLIDSLAEDNYINVLLLNKTLNET